MSDPVRNLHYLLEANRVLSSTLQPSDLLRQVLRLATEVVEAETSSLLFFDEPTGELYFDLALSENEQALKTVRLKPGEGIAGWVARERKTLIVNDCGSDPRWMRAADQCTAYTTRSVLAAPLVFQGRLLGVIEAINRKAGDFTEEDAAALEAFAAQAAVSLENARMFSRLAEEKGKIEAVFSQMSDAAVLFDASGAPVFFNDAATRLLGTAAVTGATAVTLFREFDTVPAMQAVQDAAGRHVLFEASRRQGKKLHLQGSASVITDAAGGRAGMLFIFRDVTVEKEEGLLKRNFLSLISHKLKTPLVAITGYRPLLLEDPALTVSQRKAISSIQRQGNYLASLVDKLLYFALLESASLSLDRRKTDLAVVIDQACTGLRSFFDERGAIVTIDASCRVLPPVYADAEKIAAVLQNLLENAVKFTAAVPRQVTVSCRTKPGFLGIAVTDNGPGIPPEERERVFQKFYQIEESFTGQVEGAGLGLALVKRIIEAHDGHTELHSECGQGTTVSVYLPSADGTPQGGEPC